MTKEEALTEIEKLKKYIEDIDKSIEYKNDKYFLLSSDEYLKLKENIDTFCSSVRCPWWLRDSYEEDYVKIINWHTDIYESHETYIDINKYCYAGAAVRPARKAKTDSNIHLGEKIIFSENLQFKKGFIGIFICIGKDINGYDIYLSDVPVRWMEFDSTSNIYEESAIRNYLRSLDSSKDKNIFNF